MHAHLHCYGHTFLAVIPFNLQLSVITLSNLPWILNWALYYSIHRSRLFSFSFPYLGHILYLLILTGLTCFFIMSAFSTEPMWLFSTNKPKWNSWLLGNQISLNQCFNPLGHVFFVFCLKPNICTQRVKMFECPDSGGGFLFIFTFLIRGPQMFSIFLLGLGGYQCQLCMLIPVFYIDLILQWLMTTLFTIYDHLCLISLSLLRLLLFKIPPLIYFVE